MIPFEEFEKAVMHKLLEKETSINKALRKQYRSAHVIEREFTGVGFFTDLRVPDDIAPVAEPVEYGYGNVVASINYSTVDFGFVLFVKDGKMICLEGYTWMGYWPNEIYVYALCYPEESQEIDRKYAHGKIH